MKDGRDSAPKTSVPMSTFSSFRAAATSKIRGTINNVATSMASVQASRVANGPSQNNFLFQVKDQWLRDRALRREEESKGHQRITLFPGWASKRYTDPWMQRGPETPFTLDVYVSGYAYSLRPPEDASRSQKAFMKIAKGFAALPKVPMNTEGFSTSPTSRVPKLSKSTEDLLRLAELPPPPDEMSDEMEKKILASRSLLLDPLEPPRPHFATRSESAPPLETSKWLDDAPVATPGFYNLPTSSSSSLSSNASSRSTSSTNSQASLSNTTSLAAISPQELIRLHANFDSRLQPFWGSTITNRMVRITLFTSAVSGDHLDHAHGPLETVVVKLTDQGYFGHSFHIPYETICTHPGGIHIAFGDPSTEHMLVALVELLPLPQDAFSSSPNSSPRNSNDFRPAFQSTLHYAVPKAQLPIPITDARVRLISDIDDTIKVSNILHGARAVFKNVFVRDLEELSVPGMARWYTALSERGVRFHYVSNSPFELLPVLLDFFRVGGFPEGSLKLKFYGGRSLFKGLWEPAGERKRAGVLEILDKFPESKFILVGDSGEQDMELYTSLAKEFYRADRNQILGIFIRDVHPEPVAVLSNPSPVSSAPHSPTFEQMAAGASVSNPSYFAKSPQFGEGYPGGRDNDERSPTGPSLDRNATVRASQQPGRQPPPLPPRQDTETPMSRRRIITQQPLPEGRIPQHQASVDSVMSVSSQISHTGSTYSQIAGKKNTPSTAQTTLQKKRVEFESRIARAISELPNDIVFRIFRDPEECIADAKLLVDSVIGNIRS